MTEQAASPQPQPFTTEYYDAMARPETMSDDMMHALHRLAVVHRDDDFWDGYAPGIATRKTNGELSALGRYLQRGYEQEVGSGVLLDGEALDKQRALAAVRGHIAGYALQDIGRQAAQHEGAEDGAGLVHWGAVAQGLLQAAAAVQDPEERADRLVAGVIASQFARDDMDRAEFLQRLYALDLQADAYVACKESPLVIVMDGPRAAWGPKMMQEGRGDYLVESMQRLAPVFTLEPYFLAKHLKHLELGVGVQDAAGLPSAKKLQRQVATATDDAAVYEQLQEDAEDMSLSGEKVGGALIDPYKIERFGLSETFIQAQFKHLFGETLDDLRNSEFSKTLRGIRSEVKFGKTPADFVPAPGVSADATYRIRLATGWFSTDLDSAFSTGSAPVVERFKIDPAIHPNPKRSDLTDEQGVTWRYRMMRQQMQKHNLLEQFVSYDKYQERVDLDFSGEVIGEEVWTTSESGAAVPEMVTAMLRQTLFAACAHPDLQPRPEELLELLQSNRRLLLEIATQHIAEFATGLQQEGVDPLTLDVRRDEATGKLQLVVTGRTLPPKGTLEMYAAIALGCPALAAIHESRRTGEFRKASEEAVKLGSSNFIDHAMAAAFQEAYSRGLLDLTMYTTDAYVAAT